MDWRNMAQTKSISIEKQYAHMPRATTPRQIMQEHQKAKIATEKKEEASTPKPATRHYGKQPHKPSIDIPGSGQHMSPPDPTDKTSDYWIREGHLWKRVHVVPRTSYYSPELTSDGPDGWQSTTTHRRRMDNRTTTTHNSGQDQPTLKRNHHARNYLRKMKRTINRPSRQEQHQCRSNKQNRN